jgi:predicted esterase
MTGATSRSDRAANPHAGQPVARAGRPPNLAAAAMVLVHGRGATAADILTLAGELDRPDLAYLAPQAAGRAWYPFSFLAPRDSNEPGLSSGLAVLAGLVDELAAAGVPPERVLLAGFSQGACLALEYAARHPRRYGGVAGLTGGLIGPPGTAWSENGSENGSEIGPAPGSEPGPEGGSLAGTPVLLASGDPDPHVPWARVEESAAVLERLGAEVTLRRYPGLPHTVHPDEIERLRRMVEAVAGPAPAGPAR